MWIFNGILYAALAVFFLACDKKKRLWKRKVRQEEAFEHYLSGLSAAYARTPNIADAKEEAKSAYPVRLSKEHPYVRVYEAVCGVVAADGDERADGCSVFQRNICCLKEEIRENLLLEHAKMHEFTGLDILALLPVWFLPPAQYWAVHVSEGLRAYYEGSYGFLTTLVLFGATALIYGMILWLLLPADRAKRYFRLEEALLKLSLPAAWLDGYLCRHYTKCLRKNEQLKQLQGFGNVRAFLMRKVCFGAAGLFVTAAVLLAYERLGAPAWTGFARLRRVLYAALAAALSAQIPEIALVAGQWKNRETRMAECLRLQTIVLLLAHYERTTVEDILRNMELFASVFREKIAEAADSFSYRRKQALADLKKEAPDEPMIRICEALEFCDELPVRAAFGNLEGERDYFLKKNLEERKNYRRDEAALAKMAAYIPLFLLIILKLVIPFVAEGLSELGGYSRGMAEFF